VNSKMSKQNKFINMRCPNLVCRRVLTIPISARGKSVKCKGCGTIIKVKEKTNERKSKNDL